MGFLMLPDVARLQPRQQMAMDCAVCARPLGGRGQVLGDVLHRGFLFRLWICSVLDCEGEGPVADHRDSGAPATAAPARTP